MALRYIHHPVASKETPKTAGSKALYPTGALSLSQEFHMVDDDIHLRLEGEVGGVDLDSALRFLQRSPYSSCLPGGSNEGEFQQRLVGCGS